jgi:hypothetical protein
MKGMYEVFGEFNSIEEINMAAEEQKEQGDKESLLTLAKENGIDEYAAEAYWSGDTLELTDYLNGAIGKLTVEKSNLKSQMPVDPIVDYLSNQCIDEAFARVVRAKDKNLKGCIDYTEKKCREECKRTGNQYVADMTVFEWAKEYYTEVKQ